ncbi:MAG TPA: hypothetical protein VK645_02415 [Chitinophagaceae bacterium]|nr:hypothetical protein [Chitinophagaceae bacterium]
MSVSQLLHAWLWSNFAVLYGVGDFFIIFIYCMVRFYCILIFCFITVSTYAGKSYTLSATRGDITISNASTTPALSPGDTLFIPAAGRYTSVQYRHLKGDSSNKIWVIWLPGSEVKSPVIYQQVSSYNVSYVSIEGMRHFNFYGTHRFSYGIHDIVFQHCQWVNPPGAYKDQPPLQWDDPYSPVSMVYAGRKYQTFYNVTFAGCMFDGYKNVNAIQISSNWNDSNNEINRSIALDFEFVADTFQNLTNTYPVSVQAITGTGFGCKVRNCVFKNILGPGSKQSSHSSSILWYGSIDVSYCFQENSYASLLRVIPGGWSRIPGYLNKNTACRAWRNIIHNNLSYSAFEFNRDIGGHRNKENGIYPIKASCVYNTIYRTRRTSYNGPYYGFVADNVNQDTLECAYNLIIAPEHDYPYDPGRGYIVAIVARAPKHQTVTGNKVFRTWDRSILTDTIHYKPGNAALLAGPASTNYAFITSDFNGKALTPGRSPAYVGAVEADRYAPKRKK